ncbi:hypothetical protein GCM10020358_83580 [Amorphoplanes nipponensis]|uniref:carbohydrate ABC transporter permease n=1 Tax=Actinoplanes nipponensis TaxID=135950 RepID=UPI0031F177D5
MAVLTARVRRKIQDNLLAYAFMAAGLLCFAFFSWYPLVRGVILSFQQNNFVAPPYWVGLDNYRALFDDPLFYTAWRNTLLFTGLALVLGFVLPFFIAVLLNEFRHFSGFFRVLVYLPVMLPPIVAVLLCATSTTRATACSTRCCAASGCRSRSGRSRPARR